MKGRLREVRRKHFPRLSCGRKAGEPPACVAPPAFAQVPNDLLRHILTFAWSRAFCLVSRRWAELTHLKHIKGLVSTSEVTVERLLQWQPRWVELAFILKLDLLRFLLEAHLIPTLEHLALTITFGTNNPDSCLFFKFLRESRALTSLQVMFWGSSFSTRSMQGLVALREAPNLSALLLVFNYCELTQEDARQLSSLRSHPKLQSLCLELRSSAIDTVGLGHLVQLGQSSSLVQLDLDLSTNPLIVNGAGLEPIAELARSPGLTDLSLDLSLNHLTECAAAHLATLGSMPCLRKLCLELFINQLRDGGVAVLCGGLRHATRLEALVLDVSSNGLSDAGVREIATLLGPRQAAPDPPPAPPPDP
eukprot:RCo030558